MANYGGNIISGAGTGAAAGSAAGPWGALIGGAAGGLAGLFTSIAEESDEEAKQELLDQIKAQYNLNEDEIETMMTEFYTNPDNFLGTQEDVEAYQEAIRNYNPENYVYDFEDFNYDKSVDDFVNPYYDKIIDATTKGVEHSAAGAGVGRGTGTANAIATAQAQKENELYQTALNEYNTDRSQSYNEWSGNITAMQNKLNQLKSATDTQMNNLGTLAKDYTDTQKSYTSDMIAAKQNANNANLSLASMGLSI